MRTSRLRPADVESAGRSFLRASCAYRDAKRIMAEGFAAAVAPLADVLDADTEDGGEYHDLNTVVERVIVKEAHDLLDLYDRDPKAYPAGRTDVEALAATRKAIARRYARGKCSLCKGLALPCARRHAMGRSCA